MSPRHVRVRANAVWGLLVVVAIVGNHASVAETVGTSMSPPTEDDASGGCQRLTSPEDMLLYEPLVIDCPGPHTSTLVELGFRTAPSLDPNDNIRTRIHMAASLVNPNELRPGIRLLAAGPEYLGCWRLPTSRREFDALGESLTSVVSNGELGSISECSDRSILPRVGNMTVDPYRLCTRSFSLRYDYAPNSTQRYRALVYNNGECQGQVRIEAALENDPWNGGNACTSPLKVVCGGTSLQTCSLLEPENPYLRAYPSMQIPCPFANQSVAVDFGYLTPTLTNPTSSFAAATVDVRTSVSHDGPGSLLGSFKLTQSSDYHDCRKQPETYDEFLNLRFESGPGQTQPEGPQCPPNQLFDDKYNPTEALCNAAYMNSSPNRQVRLTMVVWNHGTCQGNLTFVVSLDDRVTQEGDIDLPGQCLQPIQPVCGSRTVADQWWQQQEQEQQNFQSDSPSSVPTAIPVLTDIFPVPREPSQSPPSTPFPMGPVVSSVLTTPQPTILQSGATLSTVVSSSGRMSASAVVVVFLVVWP